MAKAKRQRLVRFLILAMTVGLAAALGYRSLARWQPPLSRLSPRADPAASAGRFCDLLRGGSDSARLLPPEPGRPSRLVIASRRGRPLVLANLGLQRQAKSCGLELLAAAEDRKRQSLELAYGIGDRPLVTVQVRMSPPALPGRPVRPRIALVAYRLAGADKAARSALARRTEIKTLVVDRPIRAPGRELLVALPLEPIGYPKQDPGPNTILLSDSDARIASKLARARGTVAAPAGFSVEAGSRALKDRRIAEQVARFCAAGNLVLLEPRYTANSLAGEQALANDCRYRSADVYIEPGVSARVAEARIRAAFVRAREKGAALAMLPARADVLNALGKALTGEVLAEFEFVGVTRLEK